MSERLEISGDEINEVDGVDHNGFRSQGKLGFNPGYKETVIGPAKKCVIFQNGHPANYVKDFPAPNQGQEF